MKRLFRLLILLAACLLCAAVAFGQVPVRNAKGQYLVKKIIVTDGWDDDGEQVFTFDYSGTELIRATMNNGNDAYVLEKRNDGIAYSYHDGFTGKDYEFNTRGHGDSLLLVQTPKLSLPAGTYDGISEHITYKYRTDDGITYMCQYKNNRSYIDGDVVNDKHLYEQGFLNTNGLIRSVGWIDFVNGEKVFPNDEYDYQLFYDSGYRDNTNLNLVIFVFFRFLDVWQFPLLTPWASLESSYLPDCTKEMTFGHVMETLTYTWLGNGIVSTITSDRAQYIEISYVMDTPEGIVYDY